MTNKDFINLLKSKYHEYYVPNHLGRTKSVAEEVNKIVQQFRKEIEDELSVQKKSKNQKK